MPHIIIETSQQLISNVNPDDLCKVVLNAAMDTHLFDDSPGGAKVRINSYNHYLNDYKNTDFIHTFVHILEGRTDQEKKDLSTRITMAIMKICPETPIISTQVIDIMKAGYTSKTMF